MKYSPPVFLTWSCLNSSQLLRANVSLSSDQHTEKANVCVRNGRGDISFRLCQLPFASLETIGAGVRDRGSMVYLEPFHLYQGYSMG